MSVHVGRGKAWLSPCCVCLTDCTDIVWVGLIYCFPAECLKVSCLKDRQQHFLGKGRERQALEEAMTCLNSLCSPSRSSGCRFHLLRLRLSPGSHRTPGGAGKALARGDPSPRAGNVLVFGMLSMHLCCCHLLLQTQANHSHQS